MYSTTSAIVNECDWLGVRDVLVALRGGLRRLVFLLDPVELSNLQARVRGHSPPASGAAPAKASTFAQGSSSDSSSAARGMRSDAIAIEGAEVRAKRDAPTALASRGNPNATDEDCRNDCIKLFSTIFKVINDSLLPTPSNSSSSFRHNITK